MSITTVTLRDPSSPAEAHVAVNFGFNCYQFTVERKGGPLEILWSAADFADGTARASGSGIPLLFPFPGRIQRGILNWQGREYRLPQGDGRGNAIHGFALNRAWRVIEQNERTVVGEFHAGRDEPQLRDLWPADFKIRATYTLKQMTLSCLLEMTNPDERPLPCGLGTHPYFRLPLGGPRAEDCQVQLPVSREWELQEMIPTGREIAVPDAPALQKGKAFRDLKFDNVFSGLAFEQGWCRSTITDPATGVRVEQRFDDAFRECVVYTPAHREAICIEPYTCVPGAFELAAKGLPAGLKVLVPGDSFRARFEIKVTV